MGLIEGAITIALKIPPHKYLTCKIREGYMRNHLAVLLICAGVSSCAKEEPAPAPIEAEIKLDHKQVFCLAKNIYFEARNEPVRGQVAVAQVTLNRVESGLYPNTICKVIYDAKKVNGKPILNGCQFSWYCDGEPDIIKYHSEAWYRSIKIAELVMRGQHPDVTGGALFYHADYVNPAWAKNKRLVRVIGRHLFYRI